MPLGWRMLEKFSLDGVARAVQDSWAVRQRFLAWRRKRENGALDRQLVANYLAHARPAKLHIGCGPNILDGWLNSDFYPQSANVFHLDATRPFPLPDESFDYVFSEHMIEHVPYSDGAAMLLECHRVLKPDGRIRISTPDLRFLVDLYGEKRSELQSRYIDWSTRTFVENAPGSDAVFVINNFVRDWGHAFIYDEKILGAALNRAGFTNVSKFELNKSDDPALCRLENESRMPEGFLRLESITLEARKPLNPAPA